MFSSILDESGVLAREAFTSPGERTIANYLYLFELLAEEATVRRAAADELVAWFEARIRRAENDPEENDETEQRLESERAAVQLMTIHASKGLEAPIVFLHGDLQRGLRRARRAHAA